MPAETHAETFVVERANEGVTRLRGALVFATARHAFDRLVASRPSSGSHSIDLSGLTTADSAGLAVLVEWRAEAARRGARLRYTGAGEGLRALARLADLDAELFG